MRDKRTLKDVCGEATPVSYKHSLRGVFVFEITKTKTPKFAVKFDLKLYGKSRTEDNWTD